MFERAAEYPPIEGEGRWYRPRSYGDPRSDGTWEGWLVFFPLIGDDEIAPPTPETTQQTWAALVTWATALTPVYLSGALDRALTVAVSRRAVAEYEALEDAERLETPSEMHHAAADPGEVAAHAARREAERLRQERLSTESALGDHEAAANLDGAIHEEAGQHPRDAAAEAAQGQRSAESSAAKRARRKQRARRKRAHRTHRHT
jgi:hypothetical protein